MTDNDNNNDAQRQEQLIEAFFAPARSMHVEDNGFSSRVMRQVAATSATVRRERLFSRLWTLACVALAVVLFIAFRGWDSIVYGLLMLVNTPLTTHHLLTLLMSVGVVGLLALSEVFSRERYSLT